MARVTNYVLLRDNTKPVGTHSASTATFVKAGRKIQSRIISSLQLLTLSNTYFIENFPISHTCNETQQTASEYLLYLHYTRNFFSLVIAKVIFLAVMK
jgi:hypothetical protein